MSALLAAPGASAATVSATYAQVGAQSVAVTAYAIGAPTKVRVVFETKRFSRKKAGAPLSISRKLPRSASVSQTLRLPRGAKQVTARVRVTERRKRKGRWRTVTIAKGEWKTVILTRNTRIPKVAPLAASQVQALVPPTETSMGSIRITGKTSRVKTGRVLAFGVTPQTPDGLLVKVTNVTRDPTGATASIAQARLTDVVPSGEMDINVAAEEVATLAGKGAGQKKAPFTCENSRKAEASVSTELSAGVQLSAKWTGVNLWRGDPGRIRADLTGQVKARLDGSVSLDGQAKCKLEQQQFFAAPVRLAVFTVQVGPVPVPVVIDGQIYLNGSAEASGSIATSVRAQAVATAGVTYEQGKGFTPRQGFEKTLRYDPPAVNGTGSAQLTLSPTIGVKLAGMAGTEIDLSGGLKLSGNLRPPAGEPWWKLTAPLSLGARFSMDFWIINAKSDRFSLWSEEPVIAQADPASAPPGSTIIDQGISPDPLPEGVKTRLTWDSDTDVDLHTWDQYGNHAYFSDLEAIPTGYLDQDVIPGYGPETFFETDRSGTSQYTFGVCQYSGYNANVTVDVRDRDGQTRRFTVVLRGRKAAALLTTSPPGIAPYIDQSADWCDSANDSDPVAIGQVTTGSFE